jgi:hypothetical protein
MMMPKIRRISLFPWVLVLGQERGTNVITRDAHYPDDHHLGPA